MYGFLNSFSLSKIKRKPPKGGFLYNYAQHDKNYLGCSPRENGMSSISVQGDVIESSARGLLTLTVSEEEFLVRAEGLVGGNFGSVGFKLKKSQLSTIADSVQKLFAVLLSYGRVEIDGCLVFPSPKKEDSEDVPRIILRQRKGEWITLQISSLKGKNIEDVVVRKDSVPVSVVVAFANLYAAMVRDQRC